VAPSGSLGFLTVPPPNARLLLTVRRCWRRVLARRRPLAALCAALAVLTAVEAASEEPDPTVEVLVAAADLPGGTTLVGQDLTVVRFREDTLPTGTVASAGDAVGRVLAAPLRRGEPLTDLRLVAPGLLEGYPGLVATPVRLADAASVAMLRVGDRIDLVAADPEGRAARAVARGAPVVALPRSASLDRDLEPGGLVVVAVSEQQALLLARAAVTQVVSYVLSGG
jgi:Flp pilus assembly protein CpaB